MTTSTTSATARTVAEQISVENTGPDVFRSRYKPEKMGNTANIAYGGCALGVAVKAACETVPSQYLLYSVTGHFLAPVSTEVPLNCSVRRLRDTRTFATRQVEVTQQQGTTNTSRLCMVILADFQKEGEKSLLSFSAPPERKYHRPEDCLTPQQIGAKMVQRGVLTEQALSYYNVLLGLLARLFETRQTPEGVFGQNLTGMAKREPTTQDSLPLTSRTSADWIRVRGPCAQRADHYAGLAFVLDAYLSFLALAHSGRFLDDAGACASLDFTMRVFSADWDLRSWLLREMKTVSGADGRTYSEARVWNQAGKLVANMTQMSILRPKREAKASL
ncbi:thioesterase family protein [Aspergillus saccharolyticus JOP 1030-1]|uniref:Acyl-CoA thioesterase II n=1 Tax=Aspergillus saccharolyticus JOP 1030-1 TaxID=1450539 RepID=A0A318ZJE3_9EURO|nr:acyl-CoA thioesterase II [Aspergillus saccharolyticus JOP 1030-1]PYH47649.1 acyl-CoA thioesterase II [Aspergillus saccharolyticus JOP 1030-1]